MKKINGTIMQCFEWYLKTNQDFWLKISNEAEKISELGITAVWLPPAYKGVGGKDEVGYGVYDIYDLLRRNVSLSEIAKEYNVSITNISNINRGKIYKFLDESNYPVYKPVNSKTRLGLEKAEKIIKMLISNPEYTYSKIGDIVGVGRKTVSGINNGKLYVDLASKLGVYKYPIR